MILQKRLTRFYRISWKHQGLRRKTTDPLAGRRRLRFSFFMDEPELQRFLESERPGHQDHFSGL